MAAPENRGGQGGRGTPRVTESFEVEGECVRTQMVDIESGVDRGVDMRDNLYRRKPPYPRQFNFDIQVVS